MTEGLLRTEGDRRGVRFERRYDATPAEIWSALTEPERMRRWLANVAELEPRPGGRFLLRWNADETDGTILAFEPGRLLELQWPYPGEPDSVARFDCGPTATAPFSSSTTADFRRARSPGTGPGGTRTSTRSRRTCPAAKATGTLGSESSARRTRPAPRRSDDRP